MMRRNGFTLLEVLLAMGVSLLLMGALYVAVDVQIRSAQVGRERVDDAVLARSILQRIRADLASALTPIAADSTSSTASASADTTTDPSAGSSSTYTMSLDAVTPFNAGIEGEIDRLTMWIARVPGATRPGSDAEGMPNGPPDIHRVTYWLAGDRGLAAQDISRVTADDQSTQLPPDVPDEDAAIIAPEVVNLEFWYFDGASWNDSWDGTMVGADGVAPIGPPKAVKIVIEIRGISGSTRKFEHVVAIQTANSQPSSSTAETTP
jgi:prepilin-type N-terminal cleavage/methylation domain-containing protein